MRQSEKEVPHPHVEFGLEDTPTETDLVIEQDGQRVFVDPESLPFLAGSVIDFKDELIGARFAVESLQDARAANAKDEVLKRIAIDLPPGRRVEARVTMRLLE